MFGYQVVNGQLIRFDQRATYEKIVKPAMEILHNNKFKGAENEFIPSYLGTNLSGIENILSQGVNALRNHLGGHGQGASIKDADAEFVEFAINAATTNILFLVRLYERHSGRNGSHLP